MKFLRSLVRIGALLSFLAAAPFSYAVESICPGGASPRGDIEACVDGEDASDCTTGQEAQCIADNGLFSLSPSTTDGFAFKVCPEGAAVGSRCISGSGAPGGTGPGYSSVDLADGTHKTQRFYVRFRNGYMQSIWSAGNHAPSFEISDGLGCASRVSPDWTASGFRAAVQTTGCGGNGPTAYGVTMTTPFVPKNDYWYAVQMRVKMNTTASSNSPTAGNGELQVWVDLDEDGDLDEIHNQSNLNIDGSQSALITSAFAARSYYAKGVPSWKPVIEYDAFAYSNDGSSIGVSADANALGTADPSSPYINFVSYHGFAEGKMSSDCAVGGDTFDKYVENSDSFRTAPTFVTSGPGDHGGYELAAGCARTNKILKVETTGTGQGSAASWTLAGNTTLRPRMFMKFHFHTSCSSSGVPVGGFIRYGAPDSAWANYLQVANVGGFIGLQTRRGGTTSGTLASAVAWPSGTWTQVQVGIDTDNKCYLQVGDTWVIDGTTCPASMTTGNYHLFDTANEGDAKAVAGVPGDSPSGTCTVYYDNVDVGTASFTDCKGWGTSCPFTAEDEEPEPTMTHFANAKSRRLNWRIRQ